MRVLEYSGLDTSRVETAYRRTIAALERDDFRAADVKKLINLHHGKFYRARLDHSNRLLFALVRHGGEVCAIMLEVIEQHAYDRSRFLRGAAIDDDKIPVIAAPPSSSRRQNRFGICMRSGVKFSISTNRCLSTMRSRRFTSRPRRSS